MVLTRSAARTRITSSPGVPKTLRCPDCPLIASSTSELPSASGVAPGANAPLAWSRTTPSEAPFAWANTLTRSVLAVVATLPPPAQVIGGLPPSCVKMRSPLTATRSCLTPLESTTLATLVVGLYVHGDAPASAGTKPSAPQASAAPQARRRGGAAVGRNETSGALGRGGGRRGAPAPPSMPPADGRWFRASGRRGPP